MSKQNEQKERKKKYTYSQTSRLKNPEHKTVEHLLRKRKEEIYK
jgi:hypothetical protein